MDRAKKASVKKLVSLLKSSLGEYTFEEILQAVPQALELFSDEEISRLVEAIHSKLK